MLYIWLSFSAHSLFIFGSSFDLTDLHLFPYNCFDSNSKRFVNCVYRRAKNRFSYKNTGKSGYQWLRVTTNNYERLPVKLQMTATAIGSNLRHKNVMNTQCFLWLHNSERSKYVEKYFKNSCATLLVKIINKWNINQAMKPHGIFLRYIEASKFVKFISDDYKFTGDYFNLPEGRNI